MKSTSENTLLTVHNLNHRFLCNATDILMDKNGNKKAERAVRLPTVTKEGDIVIKKRTNHAKFEEYEVW